MDSHESRVAHYEMPRRTVLAAAWITPVVLAASATPAFAASPSGTVVGITIVDQPENGGFVLSVTLQNDEGPIANTNFDLQSYDSSAGGFWFSTAEPTTDSAGEWLTFVNYLDVSGDITQFRALYEGAISAAVPIPRGQPTFTLSAAYFDSEISPFTAAVVYIDAPRTGILEVPYTVQNEMTPGVWGDVGGGTTDSSGDDSIILPVAYSTPLRLRVVLHTYTYFSDPVTPVPVE